MAINSNELIPINKGNAAPNTRFRDVPVLRDNNVEFFSTYIFEDVPYTDADQYHEVSPGETGRLDLIAYIYYGTVELWWLIAEANDIKMPMMEVVPGMSLRIPPINVAYDRSPT